MQKVTLYIRLTTGNRTPRRVTSKDNYPNGTVYVLRYRVQSSWQLPFG